MKLLPAPLTRRSARVAPLPFTHLEPLRIMARGSGRVLEFTAGNPVDPVPEVVRHALVEGRDSHGYPGPAIVEQVRAAVSGHLNRNHGVLVEARAVAWLPGTKSFLATLPELLDLGRPDHVVVPAVGYTSYVAGTHLADATAVLLGHDEALDALTTLPRPPRLIHLVSPSNPEASVMDVERQREIIAWARSIGALVVADEAYLDFDWTDRARSILHPDVAGDSHDGLLAVHSASKRSNMAGYRAGFVAGDSEVVAEITELMGHVATLSTPIARAACAAWSDDAHVHHQRLRYQERRDQLVPALREAGFQLTDPEGGLYLWVSSPAGDDWDTATALARSGIVGVPGRYYRADGSPERHVRLSLTVTDDDVAAAVTALRHLASQPRQLLDQRAAEPST